MPKTETVRIASCRRRDKPLRRGGIYVAPRLRRRRADAAPSDPLGRIERLFAWLLGYRRLTSRWERHAINILGFVQLGCICILLRHF